MKSRLDMRHIKHHHESNSPTYLTYLLMYMSNGWEDSWGDFSFGLLSPAHPFLAATCTFLSDFHSCGLLVSNVSFETIQITIQPTTSMQYILLHPLICSCAFDRQIHIKLDNTILCIVFGKLHTYLVSR